MFREKLLSPEPPLLQAEQCQLFQPFLIRKVLWSLHNLHSLSAMWFLQSLLFNFKFCHTLSKSGIFFFLFFWKTDFFWQVKLLCYFPVIQSRKTILYYRCSEALLSYAIKCPFPNWFEIGYETQLFHSLPSQSPGHKPVYIYELEHVVFQSSVRRSWGLVLYPETRTETADGSCISFAADSHMSSASNNVAWHFKFIVSLWIRPEPSGKELRLRRQKIQAYFLLPHW